MLIPNESAAPLLQAGAVHYQQSELDEAERAFRAALSVQPDLSPARFNLGIICRDQQRDAEAESHFQAVIAAGEILPESFNNLGVLAMRSEDDESAIEYFRKAIELRSEFPLARFNLSTVLLRLGQWQEGWREYEWRWQTPGFVPIECPQPRWRGDELDGTLLLHTEQGIGDVFQFARFIPAIRQRCRQLIFLRPENLDCMFPQSVWADETRSPGTIRLDAFDAVLPLMSAPLALGIRPDDLPAGEQYLTPEPRAIDLGPVHVAEAKLKVGVVWRGSPTYVNDAFRSISIQRLAPLFDIPHVAFYSLRVGDVADELAALGKRAERIRDLSTLQRDFADTAAIVKQLDLVISVDTAVLHLCGGMGLPAWGLLSRRSDWRWLENQYESTRWYPSLRLFRQRSLNDWDELISRVAAELQQLAGSRG